MRMIVAGMFAGLWITAPCRAVAQGDSASVVARMSSYAGSLKSGPVDSIAASFTADGKLISPGMDAVTSPAAIRGFLTPLVAAYTVESCTMTPERVELFGSTAYEWGDYTQRAGPKGGSMADYHGRFVAELQKESDGQWRIARLFMQPAPPGS